MEQVQLSVVIPTYNAEDTIALCIKSIQDSEVEILVVLDGPTDKTEEICEELAKNDKRIRLIKQENQGSFKARKNGILQAKGKYILFLDSDDTYLPETISTVRNWITKYNEPDVIRFRYIKEPDGYEQYPYIENGEEDHYISKDEFASTIYPMILETYQFNSLWCNCIKKELLQSQIDNLIPVEHYGEDLYVNLEIYTNMQNMVLSEKVLYKYHTNPKSATQTRDVQKLLVHLQDSIQLYSSFYSYLTKWNMNTSENQEKVAKRLKKETDCLIFLIKNELKEEK